MSSTITFVCPDELSDVAQVQLALVCWQLQRAREGFAAARMAHHALRVLGRVESAIPLAWWVDRNVRPEIALAEARVTKQVYIAIIS